MQAGSRERRRLMFVVLFAAVVHVSANTGELAFQLPDKHFNPEGIAFDERSGSFFVSSLRRRSIVRVAFDGAVTPFVETGRDGIWMVTGIDVDPQRRLLWAASNAADRMIGFRESDAGRSGIFVFDLDSGRLVHRLEHQRPGRRNADDLEIAPDGTVFSSDAINGAIYRVAQGSSQLEVFLPDGAFKGPQGLAVTPDGRTLFIADYAGSIDAVDVATKTRHRLLHPPEVSIRGIDGLEYASGALYAVQNGIEPNRVMRFALDAAGRAIIKADVLGINDPAFDEPTLAVVANNALYVVANSQGAAFRRAGAAAEQDQSFKPPVILAFKLAA
jgi:sugar lactone lactonase YvrE